MEDDEIVEKVDRSEWEYSKGRVFVKGKIGPTEKIKIKTLSLSLSFSQQTSPIKDQQWRA